MIRRERSFVNADHIETVEGNPDTIIVLTNGRHIIVREGTEGPYVGNGGSVRTGTPHEIATEVSVNTAFGVERVVRDVPGHAPEWSHGDSIAYLDMQGGDWGPIRLMSSAGLGRRAVGLGTTYDFGIDWSRVFNGNGPDVVGATGFATRAGPRFYLNVVNNSIEAYLSALSNKGRVHTLATPRLLALEDQEAILLVLLEAVPERERHGAGRGELLLEGLDGQTAGDLPRLVPAHAVSDDEQVGAGVAGVLVVLADPADVGDRVVAEAERLRRSLDGVGDRDRFVLGGVDRRAVGRKRLLGRQRAHHRQVGRRATHRARIRRRHSCILPVGAAPTHDTFG